MEFELKNILANYDKKLNDSLILNTKLSSEITRIKVHSFLDSMKPLKLFTLIVGIIWTFLLSISLSSILFFSPDRFELFMANPYFLVSLTIYTILHIIAIAIYLYQMILIQQVDLSDSVIKIQSQITKLKYSTLWVTRILLLQLPLWTIFWWSETMFREGNLALIIVSIVVAIIFLFASIWLFLNIKYENRNKKWFQIIFRGKEWTPLQKSMDLMDQVKEMEGQHKY